MPCTHYVRGHRPELLGNAHAILKYLGAQEGRDTKSGDVVAYEDKNPETWRAADATARTPMKCNGIETSTSDFIGIEGAPLITHVDSLLDGTRDGIFITPGFIDLQVNGFAGVITTPRRRRWRKLRIRFALSSSTGVTRFLSHRDHGIAGGHAGRAQEPGARERNACGRSRDGGVSRRGSAHFPPRWAARGASGALGASTGFRGVPTLAGCSARAYSTGYVVAGVA